MNTESNVNRLVDELGAHWTEATLEILQAAGIQGLSVDMELEIWRAVKRVLKAELRWQRAFRFSTLVSLSSLMEQVLRKAAQLVVRKVEPQSVAAAFDKRIRSSANGRTATAAERGLYAELVGQPVLRAAFKPPSRTDYFPRLRVAAAGG